MIGSGGFGTVWLVQKDGQYFGMKCVDEDYCSVIVWEHEIMQQFFGKTNLVSSCDFVGPKDNYNFCIMKLVRVFFSKTCNKNKSYHILGWPKFALQIDQSKEEFGKS